MFVDVLIGEVTASSLADSGADISVISEDLFSRLSVECDSSVIFDISGIGQGLCQTSGYVKLIVKIGPYKSDLFPFHVVPKSSIQHDMILGADFMYRYYLAPSPAHQRLLYVSPNSEPELVGSSKHFSMPLKVSEKFKLKPQALSFITVPVPSCPWKEVYFEPNEELQGKSIYFCRSLESLDTSCNLTLELLCLSGDPVVLDEGANLGVIWGTEISSFSSVSGNAVATDQDVISLFDFSKADLSPAQLDIVYKLLIDHKNAISMDDSDVGQVDILSHEIKFQKDDQQPTKIPPRRIHGKIKERISEEIGKLLEDDIIEQSDSPWSAPIVPVRKPDGSIRLCVDYRALNKVTYKDAFPLPNIEDTLYNLNGMKYFSSLDLVKGYYQVPVAESSRPFTAFATHRGHWQFKRMPFGLCNAPATFQRLMNLVLKDFPWDHVMAYLDDVLIMDGTFEDHAANVGAVLKCLGDHGLKIKPRKCQFFRSEVKFLGHMISSEGLAPLEDNIKAILDFPVPTTVKHVHQFLGMVNFYRRFIANCSTLSKPLSNLLSKGKLEWTNECQSAFDLLKHKLTSPPILVSPDFKSDQPLELYTDASQFGAGACLMQEQDGIKKVIAYVSTTFNSAECKYSVLDKELAALRWAIKRLKPFLLGNHFILYTDHKPLSYLQGVKLMDSRLARTLEEIGEFDFEICFIPGKLNVVADALSRTPHPDLVDLPQSHDVYLAGFVEIQVKGGADMLFRCISQNNFGDESHHEQIRCQVIDHLYDHPDQYNFDLKSSIKKQLRLMRQPGIMPIYECLQAYSNLANIDIYVYEEDIGFIHYRPNKIYKKTPKVKKKPLYIRSYDGVYFSLLVPDGSVDLTIYKTGSRNKSNEIHTLHILIKSDDIPQREIVQEFPIAELLSFKSRVNPDDLNCFKKLLPIRVDAIKPTKKVNFSPEVTYIPFSQPDESDPSASSRSLVDSQRPDPFIWRDTFDKDTLRDWQNSCTSLRKLRDIYVNHYPNLDKIRTACLKEQSLRRYASHVPSIKINHDGLLVKVIQRTNGPFIYSYLVPFSALGDIAMSAHCRNGHIGRKKLKNLIQNYVFHPRLWVVVRDVTRTCETCLENKKYTSPVSPGIINITVQRPFELVQVDLLELPVSKRQFKYVINAIDQHTKWFASQPLKDKSSLSVAKAFEKILASFPSLPECVMSDNGTEFTGSAFVNLLKHFNIKQKFVTPYSPASNGLVERINQTLLNLLTGLCSDPTDWDLYLSEANVIYNNTVHSELGQTPSECFTVHASKLPLHNKDKPFWKTGSPHFKPYPVGSSVGFKIQKNRGVSKKLSPRYIGPYTVIKINSNEKSYIIKSVKDPSKEIRAHHRQLRPWQPVPKYLQRSNLFRNDLVSEDETQPCNRSENVSLIPGLAPDFNSDSVRFHFAPPVRVPVIDNPVSSVVPLSSDTCNFSGFSPPFTVPDQTCNFNSPRSLNVPVSKLPPEPRSLSMPNLVNYNYEVPVNFGLENAPDLHTPPSLPSTEPYFLSTPSVISFNCSDQEEMSPVDMIHEANSYLAGQPDLNVGHDPGRYGRLTRNSRRELYPDDSPSNALFLHSDYR